MVLAQRKHSSRYARHLEKDWVIYLNTKNKQRTNINAHCMRTNVNCTPVGKYFIIDLSLVKWVPPRIWQFQTQTLGENT